jgi:DtxR family transcriptional regulator, Mn-dependent transcriptional regulator
MEFIKIEPEGGDAREIRMRDNLTHAVEDYLKVIFELTATHERATTTQIAERMGVKPASVTGMIKRLANNDPPLLQYRKHHGVELTTQGKEVALEIIRHHRLIELFLHKNLGYTWDEVHLEADRLEHVISEELEERIASALGNPIRDPHGELIPTRELNIPMRVETCLCDLRAGQEAIMARVGDDNPKFLRYLSSIGLTPGIRLSILEHSPYDDNLQLKIAGQEEPIVLGLRVTGKVFVEVI